MLVEERDFVRVGHCDFTLASFASEVSSSQEPGPLFDYGVAAVFAFKSEVDGS